MTDLKDEFSKFLDSDPRINKLSIAINLLKRAYPFLETWYHQAHAGTGLGAKALMLEINKFLKDLEKD